MTSYSNKNKNLVNRYGSIILFPLLLSGFMSFIITGISTLRLMGSDAAVNDFGMFFGTYRHVYVASWLVAFPVVMIVAPIVRRIVAKVFPQS